MFIFIQKRPVQPVVYLDRVEFVNTRSEVVGVSPEGYVQRFQKTVHSIQQALWAATEIDLQLRA